MNQIDLLAAGSGAAGFSAALKAHDCSLEVLVVEKEPMFGGSARVPDCEGRPIVGLHAAGNDMTSVMGGTCPGAGITIGPALTFGYIAARHAVAAVR